MEGRRVGGPKFRAFFTVPPQNSFFPSLSGGLLVEFCWCLKRRGAQMCTFGVLSVSDPLTTSESNCVKSNSNALRTSMESSAVGSN